MYYLMDDLEDMMRDVSSSILNSVFLKFLSHPLHPSSLPADHFFSILRSVSVMCFHRFFHRILDIIFHPRWNWPSRCCLISQCRSYVIRKLIIQKEEGGKQNELEIF